MNKQFTFLTILSAFFLILCTTFLFAQNLSTQKNEVEKSKLSIFKYLNEADKSSILINQIENTYLPRIQAEGLYIGDYSISPDGLQIVYNLYFYENSSHYEIYYLKIGQNQPKQIGRDGSFDKNIVFPFAIQYWINNNQVLLEAFDGGFPTHLGVVVYNVLTLSGVKLNINGRYISTPLAYENGTKLYYEVLGGNLPINMEEPILGDNLKYFYDLKNQKEIQIPDIPQEIKDKQKQSNKVDFGPNDQNRFYLMSNANGCSLSGCPTFYLPWTCNKAMCVERDGPQPCLGFNCITSGHDMAVEYTDCPLNKVGSNYNQGCNQCPTVTCGHTKPAIDFGDGGLWSQTGTPVLASASGNAQWRYQASGAGNYVIIRHTRVGYPGQYVYTYYMHLLQVSSKIPTSTKNDVWADILTGDQLGLEGKTGGQTSEHYHFELRDDINKSFSFYPTFSEYGGCTPKTGRTYISNNVPTNGSMLKGFDCSKTTNLYCNSTLANQTNSGLASRFSTYGNGYHDWDETGPEKIYQLEIVKAGTIEVTLNNVVYNKGSDLDVFILASSGACWNLDPLINIKGTTSGLKAKYDNAPAGTYFIIVDGVNGSTANFTINVNAPCSSSGIPNLTDAGSFRTPNGRNINITAKIKNSGTGSAGPNFTTRFYLSNDIYLGNDYFLVDLNYNNFTLLSGGTHTYQFNWNIQSSIPSGTYYLLETIDYGNKVSESNENDNSFYFAGSFYVPASLTGNIKEESVVNYINIDEMSIDKINNIDSRINESQTIPVPNSFMSINECDLRIQNHELYFSDSFKGASLSIFDILGREIFNAKAVNTNMPIEISLSGIYLVAISDETGIQCVKKIYITE